MNDQTVIERNPRIQSRDLTKNRGAVLLDLDSTAYHSVNELGALIWRVLERPLTLGDLVAHVRDAIDSPPNSLRDDVAAYVLELAERGLIRLESPSESD